jgi:excisionase family DNA binding protein
MKTDDGTKLLFTVPEAAAVLGIGTSKVWELLHDGRLRGVKIDNRRLLTRAELERFVAQLEEAS